MAYNISNTALSAIVRWRAEPWVEFADGSSFVADQWTANAYVLAATLQRVTSSLSNLNTALFWLALAIYTMVNVLRVLPGMAHRFYVSLLSLATVLLGSFYRALALPCVNFFVFALFDWPLVVSVLLCVVGVVPGPLLLVLPFWLYALERGFWVLLRVVYLPVVILRVSLLWRLICSPAWVVFWVVAHLLGGGDVLGDPVSSEYTGLGTRFGQPGVNCRIEVDEVEFDVPSCQALGAGVKRLPISSSLKGGRLRRRAVWVRRFECVLGVAPGRIGELIRGRWTPDLPSGDKPLPLNLVLAHLDAGTRLLGGGVAHAERPVDSLYYVVELVDGSRETVFPELVAKLSSYALLRQRDAVLVSSLRLRALEWCKGVGLSSSTTFVAVPTALKWAWTVSRGESAFADLLEESGEKPARWWESSR